MKHLLKMLDLSKEEILDILNLADQLKYENKKWYRASHSQGQNSRNDIPEVLYPYKSFF